MSTMVAAVGCSSDEAPGVAASGDSAAVEAARARCRALGDGWEVTAHRLSLASTVDTFSQTKSTPAEIERAADLDVAWRTADGSKYDTLFISPEGVTCGLRPGMAAATTPRMAALPDVGNGFGASDAVSEAIETATDPALPLDDGTTGDGGKPRKGIFADCSADQRSRFFDTTALTSYPYRTLGALSGDGNTMSGGCSGSKIGPRTVLTAAHCVMDSSGNISFSGFFNPGQTNTTALNGSIPWGGLFLRDWRSDRRFDYAVLYLQDSAPTVGLGWLGIAWWNDASGYTGRLAYNRGYPCGPNNSLGGTATQCCKASPRADKRCDGWMYGEDAALTSAAFQPGELLQYENDVSFGHSGSSIYAYLGDSPASIAVVTHAGPNNTALGPRFRQSMFNDVCAWIGDPSFQSAFATHALCHP